MATVKCSKCDLPAVHLLDHSKDHSGDYKAYCAKHSDQTRNRNKANPLPVREI